jgi:hypothetical protein
MKRFKYILIFSLLTVSIVSCGPTQSDAIKYNDAIYNQNTLLINVYESIDNAIGVDVTKYESALNNYNLQVAKSMEEIEKLGDFDKQSTFKDAALTYCKVFKSVADIEYKEILRIMKIPADQFTEIDKQILEDTAIQSEDKIQKGLDAFVKAQEEFAAKYKIKLELK